MIRPLPTPPDGWLLGVDTSRFQGTIDVPALQAVGVSFLFARATLGADGIDSQWSATSAACSSNGLPFGAYGVLFPSSDPAESPEVQARHFAEVVIDCGPTLAPVLDFEVSRGRPALEVLRAAVRWLDVVEDRMGRGAIVYTGPSFIRQLAKLAGPAGAAELAELARRPVFVAHYTQAFDRMPTACPPWPAWDIWQASGSWKDSEGRVVCANACWLPGTRTDVDVDFFRGTAGELEALGGRRPEGRVEQVA